MHTAVARFEINGMKNISQRDRETRATDSPDTPFRASKQDIPRARIIYPRYHVKI